MSKITKSAKDEDCLVRVPGVCNFNSETTVLAHLNGAGIGMKAPDWQAAYCCSACHAWLDFGWARTDWATPKDRDLMHLEGVIRTQARLVEKGLLVVKK